MTKHQIIVTSVIVGAGLLLALLILLMPSSSSVGDEHGVERAENEGEGAHGPHGGRHLETAGGRALEVTIYEAGVSPEMRLYPFEDDRPADLDGLDLTVELHRLGGPVDTLRFRPVGAYLLGDRIVYEPHSFDVVVRGTWDGEPVQWNYPSIEGRVEMPTEIAEANGVVLEEAGSVPIRTILNLPGEVQLNADRVARVAPGVSGTVVAVPAKLGQRVGAGATLALIESRELGQAQAAYVESLHRMELAQAAYERERRLHDRRISAAKDYQQARHDLEEAELEKQSAEQALGALGVSASQMAALGVEPEGIAVEREVRAPLPASLTTFILRAPTAGEVIERRLSVGEHVTGSEEVFTIADLSTVWVEVTVYAGDLWAVRPGQDVVVTARANDEVSAPIGRGTVRYVGPLIGEATRTARALVTLSNSEGRWRPGEFVMAEIAQGEEMVPVAVRTEAVQTWREMDVVFARYGDAFEVRPITLGRSDGTFVEVLEGLAPGTKYAAAGSFLLRADLEKAGASHDH
jgi:cobalt-zinc-cadmium efflux system membrane fusion protein